MARKKTPIHNMNVVPYIDVMLVLLIIFMITAPLVQTTFIELPKSTVDKNIESNIELITVEMVSKNLFQVKYATENPVETNSQNLLNVIETLINQKNIEIPRIFLAASPNSLYGEVVEVADKLREMENTKVSLLMQKK